MKGLKFNISLTFILLLAAGMLLMNIIITALWQRSLVNKQIENSTSILRIISIDYGNNTSVFSEKLAVLLEETHGLCAGMLKNGELEMVPPDCKQDGELRQVMNQCLTFRSDTTSCAGKTWGVLSTQRKFLYVAVPVAVAGRQVSGAIGIVLPLQPIWQTIREDQKIILVYILVNTIILSVIGFFRLAFLITRPIDRLVQDASTYSGRSNLGFISAMEGSEFRQLSSAIGSMVERIEADRVSLQDTVTSLQQANEKIRKTQQEMIRAEKLASVGRLSAGLAHEIGNPLGVVLGYLGLLRQKKLSDEERADYINRSEQELNRINLLVRQLLDFSRPLPVTAAQVHVHPLLSDILDMLRSQKRNRNIKLMERLGAENDLVTCNEEAMRQAFMNFYLNAIDAIQESDDPDSGSIITESKNLLNEQGQKVLQVTIMDNGSGIPPGHLANIFDPFFTTKDPGKGTGLGLSVSYSIIENAGGSVRAKCEGSRGTTIIVELPLDQVEG